MNPAAIAMLFFAIVTAGLVGAALYAVFGRPSSHDGRERKKQVVNGFRLAGGILLGFALMTVVVGFSQVAMGTAVSTNRFRSFSRPLAGMIAVTALVLIAMMVQRWAKYFAGWVGYSVLNGLLMVSSGHLVNNPSILVPRWISISGTALMFTSALVCLRFTEEYTLNLADRAALVSWVLTFTLAVNAGSTHAADRDAVSLALMAAGCLALVIAYWYYRAGNRRLRTARRHGSPELA